MYQELIIVVGLLLLLTLYCTIDLLAVNPAKAYHVFGDVSGVQVRFILDTGVSVSLLSSDVWEQISNKTQANTLEPWTGPQLTGVEGSPIVIHGVIAIDITIAGEVLRADILVASIISAQAILGLDILQDVKCVINTDQRVLHIAGKAIPPLQSVDQLALLSTVRVQETVNIAPFSELQVATIGSVNNSADWLLEALPPKDTVMVATAVVTPHNNGHNTTVPLQLANLSGEVFTIYKGSRIGKITPLDDSINIASVSQNLSSSSLTSIPETSQELLWKMVSDSGDTLTNAQQETVYNTLLEFADVFTAGDDNNDLLPHTIPTGTAQPIHQPLRRAPLYHKETVHKLLDDMLSKDVIHHPRALGLHQWC